jgi:predicted 3-demethylubiquinone-9 3-methyltransferase (glyoxalase superfamily)
VSWQVVPENIGALVSKQRAMEAMLGMKRLDLATPERAARGA